MAFNNLADAYRHGQGVKKDEAKAAAFHLEAFNRTLACCGAGVANHLLSLKEGHDPAELRRAAGALLRWGATLGDPVAQEALARHIRSGRLGPGRRHKRQAAYIHLKLAERLYRRTGTAKGPHADRAAAAAQWLADELTPALRQAADAEIAAWKPKPFTADPPWLGPTKPAPERHAGP